MSDAVTVSVKLPLEFFELLEKADILLPENVIMFFSSGLAYSISTNEKLRHHITGNGVDCDRLFRLACETTEGAAVLSLKKKFSDA